MSTDDDFRRKMRTQYALQEREARVACLIVEQLRGCCDMIDEQSPAVLQAILDYGKDNAATLPKHRRAFREAARLYVADALRDQRRNERRLYYGITGEPAPDDLTQD